MVVSVLPSPLILVSLGVQKVSVILISVIRRVLRMGTSGVALVQVDPVEAWLRAVHPVVSMVLLTVGDNKTDARNPFFLGYSLYFVYGFSYCDNCYGLQLWGVCN